jgi:hypothetical protein
MGIEALCGPVGSAGAENLDLIAAKRSGAFVAPGALQRVEPRVVQADDDGTQGRAATVLSLCLSKEVRAGLPWERDVIQA